MCGVGKELNILNVESKAIILFFTKSIEKYVNENIQFRFTGENQIVNICHRK